ncbi:unannotated protein [freshwater metagenome]|uniref:Unannotated protein n=1 Tax=freshwater metagenome TaxID=449393 RepID=A0A6J6HJT8_9ZZZZ|nr:hypothetical protein [Actinomycetota bacterium]MSZ96009.1 hypothetical protein [Actinomycetota bacterium]
MIDPLLNRSMNTPVPPPPAVARTTRTSSRRKHPAMSARILALGLSTTALIGMTTGYSLAQKKSAVQPVTSNFNVVGAGLKTPIDTGIVTNNAVPTTTTPNVVVVPVPQAGSATPSTVLAPVQTQAPTVQKSNGSR